DWMRKSRDAARAERADPGDPDAKEARLLYQFFPQGYEGDSLCRIELITGRMHQIRWQLASRGFPIVGDELYGGEPLDGAPGILLHARKLTFLHPIRYDEMTVTAPLPDWWPEALREAESLLSG
ncbi:MAG: RluA family pseudouridine synthase, partial [Planctomycetes bacterium]|nr:RluA family pseudouridine synthase [Planctomycetota bacterium]